MADFKKRDPEEVRKMFSGVAARYDKINRAMCFGLDRIWRGALATAAIRLANSPTPKIADFACGSGDVSLEIAKRSPAAKITGVDFCAEMLSIAEGKIRRAGFSDRVEFLMRDCLNSGLPAESFDSLTVSFGFRNFQNRQAGLAEMARVLKKGGALCILEVSRAGGILESAQSFFMGCVVPAIAGALGGNKADYQYLAKTTSEYPRPAEIEKMLCEAGFGGVRVRKFGCGLVALTTAVKK